MSANIAYYGGIVTDGLVLNLDSAKRASYPGFGNTWNSIARGSVISGSLLNGTSYNFNSSSIQFDGVDDLINVEASNVYKPQFPLTVSAAFRINSYTTNAWIFKTDNTTGNHAGIDLYINSTFQVHTNYGNNTANTAGGRRTYATANNSVSLNSWVIVTSVLPDNLNCTCYINGSAVTTSFLSGTATTLVYPGNRMSIGYRTDQSVNSWFWNGNLSFIQIYNRALSATEILRNYNAQRGRFGL